MSHIEEALSLSFWVWTSIQSFEKPMIIISIVFILFVLSNYIENLVNNLIELTNTLSSIPYLSSIEFYNYSPFCFLFSMALFK